ncbi:MAG TPA: hypothetical protein PKD00_00665 [Burkholderiales bacterium]|nr:hypothetical protein [Burkholderiales bacterium]
MIILCINYFVIVAMYTSIFVGLFSNNTYIENIGVRVLKTAFILLTVLTVYFSIPAAILTGICTILLHKLWERNATNN